MLQYVSPQKLRKKRSGFTTKLATDKKFLVRSFKKFTTKAYLGHKEKNNLPGQDNYLARAR